MTVSEISRYTASSLPGGLNAPKGLTLLHFEPIDQFEQRLKKLSEIETLGYSPYPRLFESTHTARQIVDLFADRSAEQLSLEPMEVRVAGRIVALRPHGKAAFGHILGDGKRLQFYVKLDIVGENTFKLFQLLDLGDFVGLTGKLFRTKTNELTVQVQHIELLSKALLPLPEKWHGLADVEQRFRRRYLDLIVNERARDIFVRRAKIVRELRRFFDQRGYIEVETPMMHPILGGATARPFVTHHNTFDMDLFLRIAPELYLKRLVVGGFDRVYEMNRNFRNEGIDAIHQPEFTMLEFYQAYSDYKALMDLTEELFQILLESVCGSLVVQYGGQEIDFSKFDRLSMREAICKFWPSAAGPAPKVGELSSAVGTRAVAERFNSFAHAHSADTVSADKSVSPGELIGELFEAIAERHLFQPTFIYDFPIEISPLSKARADDPSTAERFELFIAGMEIANGFSELNDPADQERRFRAQVAKGGHEVPKEVDMDYIRALCHALPPTAGEGIGVDRLAMLLTDSHAIREVILFPLLRAEAPESDSTAVASSGEDDSSPGKTK
ncbi:MAG TPA: lysine--tRNA ligase [Candidatus Acidoferrales bacterium]|nr:lysine--tRNA ligase [Candidatus Acidoferrales bacterium]